MPTWLKDAFERVLKTFLQAFLAQITASGLGLVELINDTSTLERAALAGLAAAYSLVFSMLTAFANSKSSPPRGGGGGVPISPVSLARS